MKNVILLNVILPVLITGAAMGQLSIYDIQYTEDLSGNSSQMDKVVDCAGGIVVHKFSGYRTRLFLYDPAASSGWGGITAKDLTGAGAFNEINVGDWVSFSSTLIEEFKGNTQLAFDASSSFTIESTANTVPAPLSIDTADFVINGNNRPAEKYEAMYVSISDITVGSLGLGKAGDNYELIGQNHTALASDYMNIDAEGPYHPLVSTGRQLASISGLVEQYTSEPYDYYQILTLSNDDLIVPEPATISLFAIGMGMLTNRSFHKK